MCSCVYRFEAGKEEKVKITITKLIIKGRSCETRFSKDLERYQCFGNATASVRAFNVPWNDAPGAPRDCFCSGGGMKDAMMPFSFVSTANVVELRFDVINMNASDDFTTLFFEGTWKFIRAPTCRSNLRLHGASGEITFTHPAETANDVSSPPPTMCARVNVSGTTTN